MEMTETSIHWKLEKQADDIMNRFDFDKVHAHMVEKDHKWYNGSDTSVPTLDNLKSMARSLMTTAIYSNDACTNIGTGGFMVYKMPWGLSLTFQLAWS